MRNLSRGGGYILSFFADSVEDLESISHGQKFVTKNGTDYGVPQPGSTVVVTSPNSGKTTYVMDAEGIWVVTEDISYSAVVANPSDEATAKLEKLKVNDTTYANWTKEEIKSIASESGGGKLYIHNITLKRTDTYGVPVFTCQVINSKANELQLLDFQGDIGCILNAEIQGNDETTVPPTTYIAHNSIELQPGASGPIGAIVYFEPAYPYTPGNFSLFNFSLTDGKTSFSDVVKEL